MFVFVSDQNFNHNSQLSLLLSNWLIIVYVPPCLILLSLAIKRSLPKTIWEKNKPKYLGDSSNNNNKPTIKNISIILMSREENKDLIE